MTFIGDKFEPLGKGVAATLGLPQLKYVTVPHPINRYSTEEISRLAEERYDAVVHALTAMTA